MRLSQTNLVSKLCQWLRNYGWWLIVFSGALVFFGQSFFTYFAGDDWFHLNITQIKTGSELVNFFNPLPNPQMAAFYRPLSIQVFFFLLQSFVGLEPFFYHLVVWGLFIASIYIFYQLLGVLKFEKKAKILTAIFYTLSATHFTQLYFISANQEIFLLFFVLLYLWKSLTGKKILAQWFLVAALLSKDTAVVAPVILMVIQLIQSYERKSKNEPKKFWQQFLLTNKNLWWSALLVLVYLWIRFFIFDNSAFADATYEFNFSPKMMVQSSYFYSWWLLGAPELIQDYMPNIYSFLPRFFTDFPSLAWPIITLGLTWLGFLLTTLIINVKKIAAGGVEKLILALSLIIFGLLPVIFLPTHKFTIQLSLPMLGVAILMTLLVMSWKNRYVEIGAVSLFVLFNFLTVKITAPTNYAVQRSEIARQVATYFADHYPTLPPETKVFITNAKTTGNEIANWGSSKQIAYALWHENFLQAFYHDKSIITNYEDFSGIEATKNADIILSAKLFMN